MIPLKTPAIFLLSFTSCQNLENLDLSGFTTKKKPTLYKMFQGVGRPDIFACRDEEIVRTYRNG